MLVLTRPQRDIFDQVQQFVLQNPRKPSQHRTAALTMPDTFPARERKFISTLAEELHLSVTWDEYDEEDQNLVTWRLPIPIAYQDLMYDPNSPILDFYPLEFEQDLNGKKQEWEAIVKIPFIDEQRLLRAMKCE
ncbi:hypothetical protein BDR07DRAFT_594487 [Suillus spraguei]|nr:hypothetical protein BDR07DRAFT_594487 [Suillus spraguei]